MVVIIAFCIITCSKNKKLPVSLLKNIIDKLGKNINFIKSNSSVYKCLSFFVTKWFHTEGPLVLITKYNENLEEKSPCVLVYVVRLSSHNFQGIVEQTQNLLRKLLSKNYFTWKMTDRQRIINLTWMFRRYFAKNKWTSQFKDNNWHYYQ